MLGGDQRGLVCGLYRRALKQSLDWIVDRREWRKFALAIRQQFDEHRKERDPTKAATLVQATELLLWRYRHPEPYKCKHLRSLGSPHAVKIPLRREE